MIRACVTRSPMLSILEMIIDKPHVPTLSKILRYALEG